MPSIIMGEKLEVSKDMDTETRRVPLGVGAAICPYVSYRFILFIAKVCGLLVTIGTVSISLL